jgi:hypothetical protein
MSQCPYPETLINPLSLQTESNRLYFVWHEGYESHKLETANMVINVAMLTVELETEIR